MALDLLELLGDLSNLWAPENRREFGVFAGGIGLLLTAVFGGVSMIDASAPLWMTCAAAGGLLLLVVGVCVYVADITSRKT